MAKKPDSFETARQNIIAAASELISSTDARATSLADIAKALKMSKGTLYYYYPSKEHLIIDVAENCLNEITENIFIWIDSLPEQADPKESLKALISFVFGSSSGGKLFLILVHEAVTGNETLKKRFEAKYREWCVLTEAGAIKLLGSKAERFRSQTDMFFAVLAGCIIQQSLGIDKISAEDIASFFTE